MQFRGSMVKKIREEKGYKQYFFAELLGISQSRLSKIENGKAVPTLPELIRISDFLALQVGDFVA